MKDPMGTLVDILRSDPALTAIVAVDHIGTRQTPPPAVRIRDIGMSTRPFGRGSGRLGLVLGLYAIQCYGPAVDAMGKPIDTGPITARQIAGAVVDRLDLLGPHAGSSYFLRVHTPEIGPALVDPDTRWPYHTVRAEVYAAAEAIA